MNFKRIGAAIFVASMVSSAGSLFAQQPNKLVTSEEVKADISQTMGAIEQYTVQERKEALAAAREGLAKLDAEIDRREMALRESWASLDEEARANYADAVADLRAARNRLGERVGALEAGSADAWDELKAGFANAYDAFRARWGEADSD